MKKVQTWQSRRRPEMEVMRISGTSRKTGAQAANPDLRPAMVVTGQASSALCLDPGQKRPGSSPVK